MSDQVECWPFEDCRSARFRINSLSHVGKQADEKYRCKDCGRAFEAPDERERRYDGKTRQGLARQLADPDVSEPADLRADGGQPQQGDCSDDVVLDEEHHTAPKDEHGDPAGITEDDADIYEIELQLRQTAMVAVRADSREEAWEALRMAHDRDVQEELTRTNFSGADYQPQDIITVNGVEEADIDLTDEDGGDA